MDKKKILFIVGIVLIVILGIVAIIIGKNNKKVPVEVDNLNDNVLKDTEVAGLKITDQSVITRSGLSTYMANVASAKGSKHIDKLYIIFTVGNENIEVLAIDDITFEAGDIIPIGIDFDRDISKATKIEFKTQK